MAAIALAALVGCAPRPLRVLAVGDLQLDGAARVDPLALVSALPPAEVVFANLEGPLTARGAPSGLDGEGRPSGGPIRFRAPPERASFLRGRVGVVSLANNHALDQGEAGRADTARALDGAGVRAAWAGHDAELRARGRRLTVLARDYPPEADLDGAVELVESVRRAPKPVLVSLHWGSPSLLPSDAQRRLAARLADAGAVAVLGHGPHLMQGIERRGSSVIAYSLGNFAYGCRCTDVTDAYALAFTIDAAGRAGEVRALPLHAGVAGAPPSRATDPGARDQLEMLSRDLGSRTRRTIDSLEIE